jgi:transposase InsO family protein
LLGLSERFACRVAGQHRSTQRHQPVSDTPEDPDAALRDWLRQYAKDHPRRGFRPAYHDARSEGWTVNHKKIQRLWREEGLRVPRRRRRKRHGTSTAPLTVTADAPNRVWAADFQFDSTTDGRPIKIVSTIDEHTRECLGGMVERSITGEHLIAELDRLAAERGTYPAVLRCDNGPELASAAMADWAHGHVGLHFIPPGDPWRNGYVESFNSRIRDECLNINSFWSLAQARGHQRLETRLQLPPPTFGPGLPTAGPLRCHLYPPMNDSRWPWTSSGAVRLTVDPTLAFC